MSSRIPDASASLFMDLAFLLVAALLLLIRPEALSSNEPTLQETIDSPRPAKVLERDLPGESLFLSLKRDGGLTEEDSAGNHVPVQDLEQRVTELAGDGERVVVLQVDPETSYTVYRRLSDQLLALQEDQQLDRILEPLSPENTP